MLYFTFPLVRNILSSLTKLFKQVPFITVFVEMNFLCFIYRYGIHLKVIHTSSDATDRLTQLIKQSMYFLQQQQRPHADSTIRILC